MDNFILKINQSKKNKMLLEELFESNYFGRRSFFKNAALTSQNRKIS